MDAQKIALAALYPLRYYAYLTDPRFQSRNVSSRASRASGGSVDDSSLRSDATVARI
jgi:hypothetical protein